MMEKWVVVELGIGKWYRVNSGDSLYDPFTVHLLPITTSTGWTSHARSSIITATISQRMKVLCPDVLWVSMKSCAITHKGFVREQNQDKFLVKEYADGTVLLAVADGAGGEAEGERAAEIAKESLSCFDPSSMDIRRQLVESMQAADKVIVELMERKPEFKGMGSTMTVAFFREGVVFWAHVGDSRLYLFHGDELSQITEDDTMAGFLLSEGVIDSNEARVHPGRNFLFECVGCGQFEARTGTFAVQGSDLILLTTDGLHDKISEEEMVAILKSEGDLKEKLEGLVSAALEASGRDNVTVVALEL